MSRCQFPGCLRTDVMVIPVGPDVPRIITDEDGEPAFDVNLDDPASTYVTGRACPEHQYAIKERLTQQHQPRRSAYRDGRPT